jgi:hypothetical protein
LEYFYRYTRKLQHKWLEENYENIEIVKIYCFPNDDNEISWFFDQYDFLIANTHKILYENYRTYAQGKRTMKIFINKIEKYKFNASFFFFKLLE